MYPYWNSVDKLFAWKKSQLLNLDLIDSKSKSEFSHSKVFDLQLNKMNGCYNMGGLINVILPAISFFHLWCFL